MFQTYVLRKYSVPIFLIFCGVSIAVKYAELPDVYYLGIFGVFGFLWAVDMVAYLTAINIALAKEVRLRQELELERNTAKKVLEEESSVIKEGLQRERKVAKKELESAQAKFAASMKDREAKLARELGFAKELVSAFHKDFIAGRRWLAEYIAEAVRAHDEEIANSMRVKKHPAMNAADEVRVARKERREAVARIKFLEYQLASYKEYFPFLEEYEEVILAERIDFTLRGVEALDDADRVVLYVTGDEYSKLSPTDRNQLALDRYVQRHKANWEIGRIYERYVGHKYESEGWSVNYFGAIKGFEDMGRDLICRKGGDTHIVQAKCWSKDKTIHEKHIFQLFGTALLYEAENSLLPGFVKPVFVATTDLSEVAILAAKRLGVEVRYMPLDVSYPMIKCNVNIATGEKIYHLPFDQQYDRVMIRNDGEKYVRTVSEAEAAGFRRAFRYYGEAA